jgi:hypothetical protein
MPLLTYVCDYTSKMCGIQSQSRIVTVRAMKVCVEVEAYLHPFLNLVLDRVEWSASSPSRFTPGKNLPLHIETHTKEAGLAPEPIGGWVGPRRRLGWPQSRFGHFGEKKNLLPQRDSNDDSLVAEPVA